MSSFCDFIITFLLNADYIEHSKWRKGENSEHSGEPEAIKGLRQIVEAISYCHEKRVVVRDINPGNILVNQ